MERITRLPFRKIIDLIRKREVSCEELLSATMENVKSYDVLLESYIAVEEESVLLDRARESDKRWSKGTPLSIVDGMPIAVKDNIHALGFHTTCGSRILERYRPVFDATVVSRIKEKGGIILGKTNLDEFAMGSTTETSAMKLTKNPWNTERVPGGSSGGSAVAVAAGLAPLALGSDTGGSIRQPASFCGVTGLKPTYGLVSRYGLVAFASSLDQIGPLARDVYGNAALLEIIGGHDKRDSTSLDTVAGSYCSELDMDLHGTKVAYIPEMLGDGVDPAVLELFHKNLDLLKSLGATIDEVHFPDIDYVVATYYFLATAEASSNLSRYDGVKYGMRGTEQQNYEDMLISSRTNGFGKEVKKRILLGNFVLSSGYYEAYYRKALQVRTRLMASLKEVFSEYDVVATPTTPSIAFKLGAGKADPMKLYKADITTALANLTGFPAISVPAGIVRDMPVGLQLIGKPLDEKLLLSIAGAFEQNIDFDFIPPINNREASDTVAVSKETVQKPAETIAALFTSERIREISTLYNERKKSDSDRVLCQMLPEYHGKRVHLSGRIHNINNLGGVVFYTLRDRTGMTQLVLEGPEPKQKLSQETVVDIQGLVTKEERSPYGNIEIKVDTVTVLGKADANLTVPVSSSLKDVNLPTILDNRSLTVRNPEVLLAFKVQSEIVRLFSEYLRMNDFTEIKTPKIISSGTEGGTNIFEMKYFDRIAFLAQSPQFYKQIMVGSGLERVFEVGPVFRAEKHDTIRHLNEYISLDYEMGYINDEQDIIDMQEGLIKHILKGVTSLFADELARLEVELEIPDHFPRIHFLEALDILTSCGVKDFEEGDLSPEGERVLCEYFEKEKNSPFVYVIGYPIKKRPMYTMPDERLPGYTRSFDLLYRGLEITTGGQRIHDYEMLRKNIIDFGGNPRTFTYYLDCFKFGMPPHGGLGLGLERLTKQILKLQNIREACLFPRDTSRLSP